MAIDMTNTYSDFSVFYAAAATLHNHSGSMYSVSSIIATGSRFPECKLFTHPAYLYPPLLAIMLTPLLAIPCGAALHVWVALLAILWAGSAALIVLWVRRLWTSRAEATTISLVFALLCWPLASGIMQFAQIDALILFFLLLIPLLIVHKRPALAGVCLALIAMIKIYPAVLIAYFALRGRWRMVGSALLCGALLLAFQAAAVGVQELDAMRNVLNSGSVFVGQADNFSLLRLPAWIAHVVLLPVTQATSTLGAILVAIVVVVFIAVTLSTHRQTSEVTALATPLDSTRVDLLGYAWAVCAMLLLTPLVWLHYLGWLLTPLALCGGYLLSSPPSKRRYILLGALVAGYMMATVRLPFFYDTTPEYMLGPYLGSYPLRPLLMTLHPIGELTMWAVTGIEFAYAARVPPLGYSLQETEVGGVGARAGR